MTTPKPAISYKDKSEGSWHANIDLLNKASQKSNSISVDFKAVKAENKFRMDINSTFGIYVGSFVINGDKYQALLARKKEIRIGSAENKVLGSEVLTVDLDLRILPAILFDEDISEKGWRCKLGSDGLVTLCKNTKDRLSIEWLKRDGVKREIKIENDQFTMAINIDNFGELKEVSEKTFNLPTPKNFKIIQN